VGFSFKERSSKIVTMTIQEELHPTLGVPPEASLTERCYTCGAEMPAGFRFCGQCGRALAATLAPVPGDVVTIAFLDIAGFSAFTSRASEETVRGIIRVFHWLVREQIAKYGGFEVKQLGDGFMLAFTSPRKAIGCVADVMRTCAPHEDGTGLPPAIRVCAGLNSGDAIREGDDFFGHTVNVASRIVNRAQGGQVLISEETRALAGPMEGLDFIDLGRRRLRGLHGRMRLFEVVWWKSAGRPR
jgi:class 3 adenylate cyclase